MTQVKVFAVPGGNEEEPIRLAAIQLREKDGLEVYDLIKPQAVA